MTYIMQELDKASLPKIRVEWDNYIAACYEIPGFSPEMRIYEQYLPYYSYVDRLLEKADPSAQRRVYAIVDDEVATDKYLVLTMSVQNLNGSGFAFPWNIWHPLFEAGRPSAGVKRRLTSCFLEEVVKKAKAANAGVASVKLGAAVDRRYAVNSVPYPYRNGVDWTGNWLIIGDLYSENVGSTKKARKPRTGARGTSHSRLRKAVAKVFAGVAPPTKARHVY